MNKHGLAEFDHAIIYMHSRVCWLCDWMWIINFGYVIIEYYIFVFQELLCFYFRHQVR